MGDKIKKRQRTRIKGTKTMNGLTLQPLTTTNLRHIANRFAGVIAGSVLERRSVYRTLQGKMVAASPVRTHRN